MGKDRKDQASPPNTTGGEQECQACSSEHLATSYCLHGFTIPLRHFQVIEERYPALESRFSLFFNANSSGWTFDTRSTSIVLAVCVWSLEGEVILCLNQAAHQALWHGSDFPRPSLVADLWKRSLQQTIISVDRLRVITCFECILFIRDIQPYRRLYLNVSPSQSMEEAFKH